MKEKIVKLQKYVQDLKYRLADPVPAKHTNHPHSYRQFLEREIATAQAKIEQLKGLN